MNTVEDVLTEEAGVVPVCDEGTPETALERARIKSRVRKGIAQLSPVVRTTVRLRELEGATYAEIAEETGCPMGTVMSRLHNGRRRLAEVLGRARRRRVAPDVLDDAYGGLIPSGNGLFPRRCPVNWAHCEGPEESRRC